MTFAHAFWSLSGVGAVLFFLAGYAAARARGRDDAGRRAVEGRHRLPAVAPTSASGTTFQAILERIGKTKGIRTAVLADGLGLPIASFGDQPESLAGFSGFLWQSATRAADFLPLGPIRRILIEDDRRGTVTACNVAGSEIVLATLSSGPGPELPRMVQILHEASSYLSDRSPS